MATKFHYFVLIAFLTPHAHIKAVVKPLESTGDDSPDVGIDSTGPPNPSGPKLNKTMFPPDFVFGAASSAYQVEGAAYEDDKGQSIWDNFTAMYPELIEDKSSGAVADDSYHRYKEDVAAIKSLGLDAYRFSISWSRVLPNGKLSGGINWKGIIYYYNLINELLENGIQPYVTIFHWDLPQALEDEYRGFLDRRIVDDFRDYADLLFLLYGKMVKHWITINEPWSYAVLGYAYGRFPPARCSQSIGLGSVGYSLGRFFGASPKICKGNSSVEPYLVAHHLILAHAAAVKVYREKHKMSQKGQVGITLYVEWIVPFESQILRDRDAATRALAFNFGWFMEPLHVGAYPTEMVTKVGDRLPRFTPEEVDMVKGSSDFIGINYYTGSYAKDIPCAEKKDFFSDPCVQITRKKGGKPIGKQAASNWLYIYPWGLLQLLIYTKDRYNNPVIYITENGVSRVSNGVVQSDRTREDYHISHMQNVQLVIQKYGANIKGYFIWSLMDNFEWLDGYTVRFGVVYVDYESGSLNRTYKDTDWLKRFLKPSDQF